MTIFDLLKEGWKNISVSVKKKHTIVLKTVNDEIEIIILRIIEIMVAKIQLFITGFEKKKNIFIYVCILFDKCSHYEHRWLSI